MNPSVVIGAGVLIATVIVLVIVVREARRLRRTRPYNFAMHLSETPPRRR